MAVVSDVRLSTKALTRQSGGPPVPELSLPTGEVEVRVRATISFDPEEVERAESCSYSISLFAYDGPTDAQFEPPPFPNIWWWTRLPQEIYQFMWEGLRLPPTFHGETNEKVIRAVAGGVEIDETRTVLRALVLDEDPGRAPRDPGRPPQPPNFHDDEITARVTVTSRASASSPVVRVDDPLDPIRDDQT